MSQMEFIKVVFGECYCKYFIKLKCLSDVSSQQSLCDKESIIFIVNGVIFEGLLKTNHIGTELKPCF